MTVMEKRTADPAQLDALKDKRLRRERATIRRRVFNILTDCIEGCTKQDVAGYFPKHMISTVQARMSEMKHPDNEGRSDYIIKTRLRRLGKAGIRIHVYQTPDNFEKTVQLKMGL